MDPEVGSIRRRMQRPTVVFPDPDSPTRPSVSPRETANRTPATALTSATTRARTPRFTGKYFFRSRTRSSVSPAPTGTLGVVWGADCSITSGISPFEDEMQNAECRMQKRSDVQFCILHFAFCILHSLFNAL